MIWKEIDEEFSTKRKIKNSKNRYRNTTGSFKSTIMDRIVEYESFSECLFYYNLEQESDKVLRYYPQPVEVPIPYINMGNSEMEYWYHVPDCLVILKTSQPLLCEIKHSREFLNDSENQLRFRYAHRYANERGWKYTIFIRNELSEIEIKNIQTLMGYRIEQSYYNLYIEVILNILSENSSISIYELAKHASIDVDYRLIIPVIYHLIFTKKISYDKNHIVNPYTLVYRNDTRVGDDFIARTNAHWNAICL